MIHHRTQVRVRYPDTDKMGVVYHAVYVEYMETGRTELMREIGLAYSALEASGVMLPVLDIALSIRRPAYYDELLTIHTFLRRRPTARLTLDYEVRRGDELLVAGTTVLAFTTVADMKPVRPPRRFLDAVAAADDGSGLVD